LIAWINKAKTFIHIKQILFFLVMTRVNMWIIALSVIFSVCFAQMAMYVIYLLFPLANGIIQNDFSTIKNLNGVNVIINCFPHFLNNSTRLFILLVAWIYLITIFKNIFYYFSVLCVQTQAKLATVRLRQMLIKECLNFGKNFYDKHSNAYLQQILTTSTELIETRCKLFQEFIAEMLLMIAYIFIMFTISWKLTLVIALIFPILALITRGIIQKVRAAAQGIKRMALIVNERILNMFYCMPVIQSFSKQEDEFKRFSKDSHEEIEQSFRMQKMFGLVTPIEDVATMTVNLFIAIAMAMVMKSDNSLGAANAFVFFYLAMKTVPGLNAFNRFKLGLAGLSAPLDEIEAIVKHDGSWVVHGGKELFEGIKERIEFNGLVFIYPDQCFPTLNKVSFSVEKGSITAIVGPSGSGKSTLVNVFLRFYDCPAGSILIDGRDIREFDIASLRRRVAFVGQEIFLFNDTIRNNILYGASVPVDDQSLKGLMRTIHNHDFIESMPQQYDTVVGERGSQLSGGERQRLGIARAMIKDSDILILDEATSSLDSSTEAGITQGMLSLAQGKTIMMIAHRLSTIRKADQVIYLEEGRVIEMGTLSELIDKRGQFYKQWELQKL